MVLLRLFIFLISFSALTQTLQEIRVPWGMIKVSEGVFIDDTEITVGEYLEFYYYSNNTNNPTPNLKLLPEFQIGEIPEYAFLFNFSYNASLKYGEEFTTMGFRKLPLPKDSVTSRKNYKILSKKYLTLPISYISYEQVTAYCAWRTIDTRREYGVNFIFGLPGIEEFSLINENLDSIKVSKQKVLPSGNYLNNEMTVNGGKYKEYQLLETKILSIASFYPTAKGFYDVQGNVAEMSSEKGLASGGSFMHPYKKSLRDKVLNYEKPEKWLGFRCIAKTLK